MEYLLKSVFANDLGGIKAALDQGADPNELDRDGRTPLSQAATDNQLEVAKLLLDSGAAVDAQDDLGNSALHYAAQEYHPEMASLFIVHGATVDIEDGHGNTPLWRAVFDSRGRGELITVLLRAGADKSHRNKHGKTPIDLAKTIANYDVEQFFN